MRELGFLSLWRKEYGLARSEIAAALEMPKRGAGKSEDRRRAIIGLVGRGRAAGGVKAGAFLHLADGDAVGFGEMGRHRSARNAGADDDDVEILCHCST